MVAENVTVVSLRTGKSCFSNRALVKAIFQAPRCLQILYYRVFEAWKLVSTKTLLQKAIAATFPISAIAMPIVDPRNRWRFLRDKRKECCIAMQGCEGKSLANCTISGCDFWAWDPFFCRIPCDLAPSTQKSLAIAVVWFWCAKPFWILLFVYLGSCGVRKILLMSFFRGLVFSSPLAAIWVRPCLFIAVLCFRSYIWLILISVCASTSFHCGVFLCGWHWKDKKAPSKANS